MNRGGVAYKGMSDERNGLGGSGGRSDGGGGSDGGGDDGIIRGEAGTGIACT